MSPAVGPPQDPDDPLDPGPADDDGSIGLDALPGLAEIAAKAAWHTTEFAVGSYMKAAKRLLQVAARPDTAPELAQEIRDGVRDAARGIVGIAEVEDRVRAALPPALADQLTPENPHEADEQVKQVLDKDSTDPATLTDAGQELLRRSRDVWYEDEAHPAYERILSELAPDEGRILKLLLVSGPQPSVDVRTGGPLGLLNSRLIAPGLNMIGARAGCRYVERVPQYLNNLFRLGLVWFSRETLRDPIRYQVVEAQPEVLAALHSVRYAKMVRRSIHLTPFGEDFCRTALGLRDVDYATLPEHSDPPENQSGSKVASPPSE